VAGVESVDYIVEFDGPVKCEVQDGYMLRVYGTEFIQSFFRGTRTVLELWAKPLKTSVLLNLDYVDYKLFTNYIEFYLDRFPVKLDRKAACWATVRIDF